MATRRFLLLSDVAEVLNISAAQAYALVRNGELLAIKVGGRGQWRVEVSVLDDYIARAYQQTQEFVATHPFTRSPEDLDDTTEPGSARPHRGDRGGGDQP